MLFPRIRSQVPNTMWNNVHVQILHYTIKNTLGIIYGLTFCQGHEDPQEQKLKEKLKSNF